MDNFGDNFVDILWITGITLWITVYSCGYVDNLFHNCGYLLACLDACVDNFGDNFVDILCAVWINRPLAVRLCGYVDNFERFVDNFCWSYG